MGRAGHDTEVIVVGAGPVGLLLAGELRMGGVDVTVVERLPEPTGESRASQLTSRTMEILDQRGLRDRLGPVPSEPAGHFGGMRLAVDGVRTPFPGHWKVPQFQTEALLEAWASELGVKIRRRVELQGLAAHDHHVEARVGTPDGPEVIRASYLVGCDGEHSTVREAAGLEFAGTGATRELLRADVAGIDVPDRRFERHPAGLAVAARRADGITRVMLHHYGRPLRPRAGPPEFAEVVDGWARIVGEDISAGTPLWVDVFDNDSRQATRYRRDRVIVAGDAAHRHMPIGGQALNLGLHDAFNLGWKLAREVRGPTTEGLLDSYHDERHPVAARLRAGVAAQEMLLLGGPELTPLRALVGELLGLADVRSHVAATATGLDVRYDVGPGDHPLLGARLPPCRLTTRAGPVHTTELLGSHRALLLELSAESDDGRYRRVDTRWAGRIRTVAARPGWDTAQDFDGACALLVRPDGHVAWTDAGPGPLDAALHRWLGPPEPRSVPIRADGRIGAARTSSQTHITDHRRRTP